MNFISFSTYCTVRYFWLALLTFAVGISSCSNECDQSTDQSRTALYTQYISGYTAGVIKSNSVIKVRLMQEVSNITAGQKATGKLFSFSPAIQGETFWENAQTVVFKPEDVFRADTKYTVNFSLNEIFEQVPDSLQTFLFNFQTIQQAYELKIFGLETASIDQSDEYKLTGEIQTADYADSKSIEKMLTATQNNKALKIDWTHLEDTRHSFEINEVARGKNPGKVNVQWSGESIGVDHTGKQEVQVPAMGDYSVLSASLVQTNEQYLSVLFSNPISEKQDLSGLIFIGSESGADRAARWVINKNELKIYPSQQTLQNLDEVTVRIARDVKSWEGKKLANSFEKILALPKTEPSIELLANNGVIMAGKDQMVLPFKAIGLKAVDVEVIQIYEDNMLQYLQVNSLGNNYQLKRVGRPVRHKKIDLQSVGVADLNSWNRFTLDLSELMEIEKGAMYQVALNFRQDYSLYFCPGTAVEDNLQSTDQNWADPDADDSYWDYYENNYNYDWSQRNNPCHPTYYGKRRERSKLVMSSEIGLIAKRGEKGDLIVFATNLKTTQPMEGVLINIYDYQQQLIKSVKTAGNGMLSVPVERKPFVLVANYDGQFGYLKVDDGSSLSMSNFDVGGEKVQQGLKGFIYGERGVWRPGDTLFLDFMLEDKLKTLPAEHPVVMELYNPQGQMHSRNLSKNSQGGLYSFVLSTLEEAPTGNWSVKARVGNATFSKTVKIETVKPNRLKVKLNFENDFLSAEESNSKAHLFSQWLHGAKASNLKATIDMSASPVTTSFKKYPGYSFDDPSKDFSFSSEEVFSGRLDRDGNAVVNIKTILGENAPGMLRAIFRTKVFEEGGDFSINTTSVPFYPYESFVGVKTPEGDSRHMLLTDKDHTVMIAAVNAEGKPVNREGVQVEVYKVNWKWWWDNSYDDLSNYMGRSHQEVVQKGKVNIVNGKAEWTLNVKYPQWGRYLIRVTDPVSGHSAGKLVYIDWPGWAGKGKGALGGATMLSFTPDKETYQVGEKASLYIPSSAGGRALISIESGSKILNAFWAETETEKTRVTFDVTKDMAPNVFVHVTLLQPHAQTKNDLPIRMYGVQMIHVEDPATILNPVVEMPESLAPETPFTIKVKESSGKSMSYTIAIVDEGLLDLTNYNTPSPHEKIYAREALGVKTWDMYDQVIGAYGSQMERLLSIGGDGEIQGPEEKEESRFKPVVRHIGPFLLEGGKTGTHTVTLPPYVGSVRTMLVAKHESAYGSTEKTTPVKQALMVLPTLPRVVGPGEKIALPISVFASEDHIGETTVSVKTSGKLKVRGDTQQKLIFNKAEEKMLFFELEAEQAIGTAKVTVEARSSGAKSHYEVALQVRAANPPVNHTIAKLVKGGERIEIPYQPAGISGTNSATIEVSSLPPLNLEQRLQYLIRYPHGCVEQTTSSVFVQLYMNNLLDLSEQQKQIIQKNIEAGIAHLQSFQTSSGGLGYWPGHTEANIWGTNYAGHFLIEAQRQGYFVPATMLDQWAEFQTRLARQWSPDAITTSDNALSQAYRLYTLALLDKPVMVAMNRMRESDHISPSAKWRLALTYAKIGQLEAAGKLVEGLSLREISDNQQQYGFTYGSPTRDRAMILETLTYLKRNEEAFSLVKLLSEELSNPDRWMSTQTTAYSLVAISEYAKANNVGSSINVDVTANGLSKQLRSGQFLHQISLEEVNQKQLINLQNNGDQTLFVQMIQRGVPIEGGETPSASKVTMKVIYKTKEGTPIENIQDVKQGQDFMVEVTVHNPGLQGDYKDMALTQIFPSGWEIINDRLMEGAQPADMDQPEYQDIRDDRVYTYFDLKANERKTFKILLNASYKGSFYLPAFVVEAMYDHSIYANTQGQWITVKP